MVLRLATLSDPVRAACAACKEQKRLTFEAYRTEKPERKWRICYTCFRLPEDKLLAILEGRDSR